jgi:hypothetical protein
MSQVVVSAIDQILTGTGVEPGFVGAATGTELGHDDEAFGIRMERPLDQLIGDVRPVVVAGVDVIHAGLDGLSQHGERGIDVARRSEDLRPGELHRAVAHAVEHHRCAG